MSALQSMKARLLETGLYRFPCAGDGGMVEAELAALALGLSFVEDALSELRREGFAGTASAWGLDLWEDAAGLDNIAMATERRQEALLTRAAAHTASEGDLVSGLSALGLAAQPGYDAATGTVVFLCTPVISNSWERARIAACVRVLLPCHLRAVLTVGGAAWNDLDAHDEAWQQMDARDESWDARESGDAPDIIVE